MTGLKSNISKIKTGRECDAMIKKRQNTIDNAAEDIRQLKIRKSQLSYESENQLEFRKEFLNGN